MKVFCFGNGFLVEDSLAKEVADELQIEGVEFIKCDSPSEILDEKDVIIMDVVEGIKHVILFNNLDKIESNKLFSVHDFDLAFQLKLKKQLGELNKVLIIGIPMKGEKEKIKKELRLLFTNLRGKF